MKFIQKITLLVLLGIMQFSFAQAQDNTLSDADSSRNKWIPDYAYLQFAGGQGLLSLGAGYKLGERERSYLDLGYGFVPSGVRGRAKNIINIKYSAWLIRPIHLKENIDLELLGLGLAPSLYIGPDHTTLKEGYPEGYYWFSHAADIRFTISAKLNYKLDQSQTIKEISLYGDIGRTVLYSVNQFKNPEMYLDHFVNASLGVLLHFD